MRRPSRRASKEETRQVLEARSAAGFLLAGFAFGRLRFLDSSWLRFELRRTRPESGRRKLLSMVPVGGDYVPLSPEVKRHASFLRNALGLTADPSGEPDCRHLASAIEGGADFLITIDSNFFEKCRQHA